MFLFLLLCLNNFYFTYSAFFCSPIRVKPHPCFHRIEMESTQTRLPVCSSAATNEFMSNIKTDPTAQHPKIEAWSNVTSVVWWKYLKGWINNSWTNVPALIPECICYKYFYEEATGSDSSQPTDLWGICSCESIKLSQKFKSLILNLNWIIWPTRVWSSYTDNF